MLVLTRVVDTSIIIGDGENKVEVVILGINGSQVKVGILAPTNIPVHRREIYERIQRSNQNDN